MIPAFLPAPDLRAGFRQVDSAGYLMSSEVSFFQLTAQYPDEASAERYFIAQRWPNGVRCAWCASADVQRGTQPGRNRQLWRCGACDRQFSVTSGTVMDSTKLPLRKWLFAFHLLGASKKGMSALQLSRMLGIAYRAAWHLCHRIRETMAENGQKFTGIVETDETYIGGKRRGVGRGYRAEKAAVQTIIRRNSPGKNDSRAQTIALSYEKVDGRTVGPKLHKHTIPSRTVLMTDDAPMYERLGERFKDHHTVNHKRKEYVREDWDGHLATTNTAEGYFANLKRQIHGTHHHTSKKHLPKYLEEHDYKYNTRGETDAERTEQAIQNIEGRRLRLYQPASGSGAALFDGKAGERRRKPKRPVKKRRNTKTARLVTQAIGPRPLPPREPPTPSKTPKTPGKAGRPGGR